MKKMYLLMLFSLMFLLISCQSSTDDIPLIIYDMNDNYMRDFEEKIKLSSGSLTYHTYDSQNSQIIQNEIFEQLIEEGYRTFVINPVDRLSVFALIEKAKAVDATIVFINREPLESDMDLYDQVYYVGADAAQSARLQAELVMELFGNQPDQLNQFDLNQDQAIQTVILKGEQGHQDAEQRTKVVVECLEEQGYTIDLLETKIANFDMQQATLAMESLIQLYDHDIELVLANNDAMAVGAIDALKAADYFNDMNADGIIDRQVEDWIPVIGIDGLDIAIEQIETGYLYGTVLNDSLSMAQAINELIEYIKNDKNFDTFSYEITNDKYIWINYQTFTLSSS